MSCVENNEKLLLASNGSTDWKIIVSHEAPLPEKYAAEELQKFLKEICGADFAVGDDCSAASAHEILVGFSSRTEALGVDFQPETLGTDGLVVRTAGGKLVLAGGKPRGTLYAVYEFLEETLGCRWFSEKVSRIPKRGRVEIPELNTRQVPEMEYREDFWRCAFDGDWAARNRVLGQFHQLDEKHGGTVRYNKLGFVHTFNALVPVEEFFDTHPEYFSEVDGVRIRERTQLCLTNPDVLRIATERVMKALDEDPTAQIISVAQNDCYNPCQCEKCRALDEREGSHSGTLLYFVNQIAEAVAKKYPNVKVDTLAYQYTRKPPKTIKPAPNVIVRLCSIECCFSHPLESCREVTSFRAKTGKGPSFVEDLQGWAKICNQLYVWDYVTNFMHFLQPFPNFQVLAPNIRFLIDNHVTGIFEEGNGESVGGEFAELRAYVLAKLLWNPEYGTDRAIDEFLTGYYGMAAAPIREYIDLLRDKVVNENIHMGIYDPPSAAYLSKDVVEKSLQLFARAETLAENEEILGRVRHARMAVDYVVLAQMDKDDPARKATIAKFFDRVKEEGITSVRESYTIEQMRKIFEELPENAHFHQ